MARFALSAATSRRISTAFADSRCVDSCNAAIDFLFGIPAKCLLASPFTYAPLKEKEEVSAVKPAVPKVAKPGKGFIKRQRTVRLCYSTPAGLILLRPVVSLLRSTLSSDTCTSCPNTGRYSSPLGKWPAADCARRLERPRVPRGSHRGTASVPGQLIAYLSPRGQLLAGMRALAPTRPRAHPRLRDRAWRTGRRDCVVLWCSIWCRAAIALLNARAPLTGLASVHLVINLAAAVRRAAGAAQRS